MIFCVECDTFVETEDLHIDCPGNSEEIDEQDQGESILSISPPGTPQHEPFRRLVQCLICTDPIGIVDESDEEDVECDCGHNWGPFR